MHNPRGGADIDALAERLQNDGVHAFADSWRALLSPAMGAVLMSVSTVIVSINAKLLDRVKLSSSPEATKT